MDAICLAAGLLFAYCGEEAMLSWNHSIEKVVWEEEYRVDHGGLRLVLARVRGSGAGMEPPEGAVLRNGSWQYTPALPMLPEVQLRHSPYASPYTLCCSGHCQSLTTWLPGLPTETIVSLKPCK